LEKARDFGKRTLPATGAPGPTECASTRHENLHLQ
jgi:hypothetical protein